MAIPPRHAPQSPRAASAREDSNRAAREDRHERSAARPDPSHLPPERRQPTQEEQSSAVAKENPPNPQTGPSSSELNSMSSAAKDELIKDQEGTDQDTSKKD